MPGSTGYHKLSRFMVDEKYTIFRKFRTSAARDLLYLQAELAQLEDEFAILQDHDRDKGGEEKLYDRNWKILSTSKDRNRGGKQWEKALEIRTKLREYYDCASQYANIINIPRARKRDITMLKDWITHPDLGGGIAFSGDDLNLNPGRRSVYDRVHYSDLMILDNRAGEDDLFTRFFAGPVFHLLERVWRYLKKPVNIDDETLDSRSNLFHYSDSHIIGTIDILGTVFASMTPLVSIIILYFVQNLGARLGVLCACTFAFSMSLALVTKGRRIEIFACTAAFASVQVVFVGSTNK